MKMRPMKIALSGPLILVTWFERKSSKETSNAGKEQMIQLKYISLLWLYLWLFKNDFV